MSLSLLEAPSDRVTRSLDSFLNTSKKSTDAGLALDCCELNQNHAVQIASVLESVSVKALYLRGSALSVSFLDSLVNAIPLCVHLQELDLRWSGLNDSGAKLIARVLPFTSIKELLLGNNRISDVGAKEIASNLVRNKIIEVLDMKNNSLSPTAITNFESVFLENTTLKTLYLDGNKVSVKALSQVLPKIVRNTSITTLTLTCAPDVSSEVREALVTLRNTLLCEFDRLASKERHEAEEKKVRSRRRVEKQVEEKNDLYADWVVPGKREDKAEQEEKKEGDEIEEENEEEDGECDVIMLHRLARETITSVMHHNTQLQKAVVGQLDEISRVIQREADRRIKKEKEKASKKCSKMRYRLEREQIANHKLETTLSTVDDENIGYLAVIRNKKQEITEKDMEIALLKARVKKLASSRKLEHTDLEEISVDGVNTNTSTNTNTLGDPLNLALTIAEQTQEATNILEHQNAALVAQVFEQECLIARLRSENEQLTAQPSHIFVAPPQTSSSHCHDESDKECVICKDAHRSIAFIPCGHLSCCETCSEPLTECPVCRTTSSLKCRIYI